MTSPATPKPALSVSDVVALIVGVVIGAGIFKHPSMVAGNTGSPAEFMLLWLLGGVVSVIGALCYAELATTFPSAGGDYHFLHRAYGGSLSFLFAWARLTVIQTGSIAIQAFILGDYASQLLRLGAHSTPIYAALVIILITGLNLAGVQPGKWAQTALSVATVLGLVLVTVVGLVLAPAAGSGAAAGSASPGSSGALGLAMVFVLLTYGGWNEAAYLSAELRDVRRSMTRALLWGLGVVTVVYLLANMAYLRGLGPAAMAKSDAVAADLLRRGLGEGGAGLISLLISVAVLSTINGTVITGARTNYALGQDFALFRPLGQWNQRLGTPTNALLAQGAIALALVLFGTLTRERFATMVDYTAPVFWFFFLLVGLSLFVLRSKEPGVERPFTVPLYPLTPMLFCAVCAYMLWSSLAYTKVGAWVGVAVLVAGVPLLLLSRSRPALSSETRSHS